MAHRSQFAKKAPRLGAARKALALLLLAGAWCCEPSGEAGTSLSSLKPAKPGRPNILFLMVDDLRTELGCYGGQAQTPHMDSLASQALLFERAYCQAPGCAPSRSSLLYGLRPHQSGKYGFNFDHDVPAFDNKLTFPGLLKRHGYRVMGTGKIAHQLATLSEDTLRGPQPQNWHRYYPSFTNAIIDFYGTVSEKDWHQIRYNMAFGPVQEAEDQLSDYRHTSWAIEQLQKNYDRPFFLALGLYRPHLPFTAPQKYFDQYDTAQLELPDEPFLAKSLPAGAAFHQAVHHPDHQRLAAQNLKMEAFRAYLACISYADHQVGRILRALQQSPHAENTVVILASDHGFHMGEKATYRKFTLWREAARVPLMISAPNSKPRRIACPTELLDLYPTITDMARIQKPDYVEGNSLKPLLSGADCRQTQALTTWGAGNHALSFKGRRYIRYADSGAELYNTRKDPAEQHNLLAPKNQALEKYQALIPPDTAPQVPDRDWVQHFGK